MAAELFTRIAADPEFSQCFDDDPAAAMKILFPEELRDVPKERLAFVIDAHIERANALFGPSLRTSEAAILGSIIKKVIKTTKIKKSYQGCRSGHSNRVN